MPALAIGGLWWWSNQRVDAYADDQSAPPAAPALASPAAPVLSLRRSPTPLARDLDRRAFGSTFKTVGAGVNDASCFAVAVDGRILVDRHASQLVMPASNMKLITAAVALDVLGPDHTFTTKVAGRLENGTVRGDLSFVGGGDPVLATTKYATSGEYPETTFTSLDQLADQIVAAGVRRIEGAVVADDSRFDTERYVPTWGADIRKSEAGPLSAVLVNDGNVLDGRQVRQPDDPAGAAAQQLTVLLRDRGVRVGSDGRAGPQTPGAPVIASITSPPLSAIVGEMLTNSDDNTAELVLKEMALKATGQGTRAAGTAYELQHLAGWGIPTNGLVLVDGSGLDRGNRVSCATFIAVLAHVGTKGPIFDGLPIAARTGTLAIDADNRNALAGTAAAGRLRGKTGTLTGAKSLSGFYPLDDGRTIEFSLIVNAADAKPRALGLWRQLGVTLGSVPPPVSPDELAPARAAGG